MVASDHFGWRSTNYLSQVTLVWFEQFKNKVPWSEECVLIMASLGHTSHSTEAFRWWPGHAAKGRQLLALPTGLIARCKIRGKLRKIASRFLVVAINFKQRPGHARKGR